MKDEVFIPFAYSCKQTDRRLIMKDETFLRLEKQMCINLFVLLSNVKLDNDSILADTKKTTALI